MRIEDVNSERSAGKARIAAKVIWEDTDRPADQVFFETDDAFADSLAPSADAFLAAALSPALWAGERRIHVHGVVCPELLDNLRSVHKLFNAWFKIPGAGMVIEATPRPAPAVASGERDAAFFFSGGIDSLAAFRSNRTSCPPGHPLYLKRGLIVYGLEVETEEPFRYVVDALGEMAQAAALTMMPVATNVRCLNPDWTFWYNGYMGPALCAVAHAMGGRVSSATIGSDYDAAHLVPHGSHPLIEPNFSSYSVRIRYHGLTMTRLEKARMVAAWEPALRNLRVCNKPDLYRPGVLNCGACEKCARTMLELIATGAFDRADVFLRRDMTPQIVEQLYMPPKVQPFYEELIAPLAEAGRHDLSHAVQRTLTRARGETGLTGRLRKFDRDRLNGSLSSLKRAFVPLPN
jgi:hypothetical protein